MYGSGAGGAGERGALVRCLPFVVDTKLEHCSTLTRDRLSDVSRNDPSPLSYRWFLAQEGIRLYINEAGELRSLVAHVPAGEVRDFISANRAAIVEELTARND